MSLLSHPVSLSRSPLDAMTPNPTDRLRVISLSLLARIQIFIRVQPSQCSVWHQQSCATRTRPCGDLRDLERMSQKNAPHPPHPLLVAALCIARPLRTEGHKCICSRFPTSVREVFFGKMTKWLIPWLLVASLKPDSLNNWIHICATYQHCWWAQTVMWHLNILIKNACSEGKQRGAPARED